MNTVDIALLVILAAFILAGFWLGIIHMIGSFLGVFVGIWAAGHYYGQMAALLQACGLDNANLAKALGFVITFILVNRLFGLVVFIIDKTFKFIAIIPFLKTFNRLLGAALGLVEGTVVLALGVWFVGRFPFSNALIPRLQDSELAGALNAVGGILTWLLPEALRAMRSVIG